MYKLQMFAFYFMTIRIIDFEQDIDHAFEVKRMLRAY